MGITTVLPAKSDSKVMFCLQNYQGLIIYRSTDLSIRVSSGEVYTLVFYLAIVSKVFHHCKLLVDTTVIHEIS